MKGCIPSACALHNHLSITKSNQDHVDCREDLQKKKHGEAIHRLLTQLQGWALSNGGSKQRCKEAILSVLISEPHLPETTQLLLLWFHDENVPDYF